MNLRVADVSDHQDIFNYDLFRPSFDGYYIKVTEGDYFTASKWTNHYRGLGGRPRAPYHYMGKRGNWAGQVNKFLDQCGSVGWEWQHVLDAEFNSQVQKGDPTSDDINNWKAEFRRQAGVQKFVVYIGRSTWLSTAPPREWWDPDISIIGARYFQDNFITAFQDFGLAHQALIAVQYWNKGTAPGLSNNVDLNNFISLPLNGVDDMTPEQIRQMFDFLRYLAQHAHTQTRELTGNLDGTPTFDWDFDNNRVGSFNGHIEGFPSVVEGSTAKLPPAAFLQNIDARTYRMEPLINYLSNGNIDVNALAAKIKDNLAPELVKALGQKLSS